MRPLDSSISGGTASPGRLGRYRVVETGELAEADINRWIELRASNSALDSPYFHPGFVAAVAATRPGVRVIIGEDGNGVTVSFLPVQLDKRTCRPAGSPAVDFQGPICAPGADFDITAALSMSGASTYAFDHLRDGVASFDPWVIGRQQSPYLDVSGGMEGYLSRASRSGRDKVAEARRLSRKAERDYGSLHFVAESTDPALLDAVIAMKRSQYLKSGSRDYFSDGRHVALLHRLLSTRDTDFGGQLSAIYAGPHLLAAHFGLRAGPILHWWFPVYAPEFARLSPGWLLLRAIIDAAPDLGVDRIDLGRGVDDYKRRAMTGHQLVCEGTVMRNKLRYRTALGQRRLVAAVKLSPPAPALRAAVHYARRRFS